MPVHAQMRCLTCTFAVVSASPSANEGRRLVTGDVPAERPSSTSFASISVVSAFVFEAIDEARVGVDLGRLAELAHAEAAENTTLPSCTRPSQTPGTSSSSCAV